MRWPPWKNRGPTPQECEIQSLRFHNAALNSELAVLTDRISALRQRELELEHSNASMKEATAALGRFIATSHRLTGKPKPGTIKEMLAHASR